MLNEEVMREAGITKSPMNRIRKMQAKFLMRREWLKQIKTRGNLRLRRSEREKIFVSPADWLNTKKVK